MTRYLLALSLVLVSCTVAPIVPTPEPVPSAVAQVDTAPMIKALTTIAAKSECARYQFENGQEESPYPGYLKGMALAYAKEVCHPNPRVGQPLDESKSEGERDRFDAISWLNSDFVKRGIDKSPMPRKVYNLMIGSAMQESSGRYCAGRDPKPAYTDPVKAEAGLFQTSYDSMGVGATKNEKERQELVKVWESPTKACFREVFNEGTGCPTSFSVVGTGPGADFQRRNRECPIFAADYHAVMLRVERRHYGPVNGRYALPNAACDKMLAQVEDYVRQNPSVCNAL